MGDGDIGMAGDADIRMPPEEWNALITDAVHGSGRRPYTTLDAVCPDPCPTFGAPRKAPRHSFDTRLTLVCSKTSWLLCSNAPLLLLGSFAAATLLCPRLQPPPLPLA